MRNKILLPNKRFFLNHSGTSSPKKSQERKVFLSEKSEDMIIEGNWGAFMDALMKINFGVEQDQLEEERIYFCMHLAFCIGMAVEDLVNLCKNKPTKQEVYAMGVQAALEILLSGLLKYYPENYKVTDEFISFAIKATANFKEVIKHIELQQWSD